MAGIIIDYTIGTLKILQFVQLAPHSIAYSLFIGIVTPYSTLQTHVLWGRHHPNDVNISFHSGLKEYSTLYCHYCPPRTLCPLLKVGTHHGMHNAIDHSHPLGIAKHIRS